MELQPRSFSIAVAQLNVASVACHVLFFVSGSKTVDWTNQGQTKCCRELHLYIEVQLLII